MASARRHRSGFLNLKPLDYTTDANCNNGTYYIQPTDEKPSKRCPNICTMFWIFLVFCSVFVVGGFLGYYLREALRDEHGDSWSAGPGPVEHLGGQRDQLWLDPDLRLSVHENIMYDITGESIATNLRLLPDIENTMSGGDWDKSSAIKVKAILEKLMFDHVELHEHQVVTSFPNPQKPNRLQIIDSSGQVIQDWSFGGKNNSALQDGGTNVSANGKKDKIPTIPPYVAFSGKGSVKGELVYGHYGRIQDIALLKKQNIQLTNKILLLRLGQIPVREKIAHVSDVGGAGVLLYWDPDDLHRKPHLKTDIPYSSVDGNDSSNLLVQTVSMVMAETLLQQQQGVRAPTEWNGGFNISYRLGRKRLSPLINQIVLTVNTETEVKIIHNVVATVHGSTEPDRYVLIGAPRTSFPDVAMETKLSTAMLLSIAGALHDSLGLRAVHWVPRRTIKLCSWGGGEFRDLGMHLYMKDRIDVLRMKAVAYLDLTSSVTGNETLNVAALPSYLSLIQLATQRVSAPSHHQQSLYRLWVESIGKSPPPLSIYPSGESRYPMLDRLGVPTIRYQYSLLQTHKPIHTDVEEMAKLQSQDTLHHYRYHVAIARVTTITMLTLIDSSFYSQINMSDYGSYMFNRVQSLVERYEQKQDVEISTSINALHKIALRFLRSAQSFEIFTPTHFTNTDELLVRRLNDHFLLLDRSLLYKHPNSQRTSHVFSGSQTDDIFSKVNQLIQTSPETRQWNETVNALIHLTDIITQATLTFRVGE